MELSQNGLARRLRCAAPHQRDCGWESGALPILTFGSRAISAFLRILGLQMDYDLMQKGAVRSTAI